MFKCLEGNIASILKLKCMDEIGAKTVDEPTGKNSPETVVQELIRNPQRQTKDSSEGNESESGRMLVGQKPLEFWMNSPMR